MSDDLIEKYKHKSTNILQFDADHVGPVDE